MDLGDDSDVLLLKVSGGLFDNYENLLPTVLYAIDDDTAEKTILFHQPRDSVDKLVQLLEPFQESPQLLDPHLPRFITPLASAYVTWIRASSHPEVPATHYPLPQTLARLLYTFVKIRGYKVISRFFPSEPFLLEPVYALFQNLGGLIEECWELRYILLLWLSHLLLAPFDLATISSDEECHNELDGTVLDVKGLPSLCKRLLALGMRYLGSSGNRESEAAALLLVRLTLRRDMREVGLLDAMVTWGSGVVRAKEEEGGKSSVFLKTGMLQVLANFLAQGEPTAVRKHVPGIYALVKELQDGEAAEWESAGVRRLGMKVYRWVARLSLDGHGEEELIEDIIERLLNALGDRDTAVRFGASKSLAVVSRKLDPEMAGDVLEAVMGVFEEDVFLDPPIAKPGFAQRKIYTAVSPERWHGATLTLATFLRQRAVRTTEVLQRALGCMIEALSFEQRRSTFAMGGNVRDAACYAAWSLARSYTTAELTAGGPITIPMTAIATPRSMLQILATELLVAACLDPMGNVRRASSAALQELVGRHQNCVKRGIELVQAVDYSAVALRRRSVIDVAHNAAILDEEYWRAVVFGIVDGWRGVGSSDEDGRKYAAKSLGSLMQVGVAGQEQASVERRFEEVFNALMERLVAEGTKHSDIYHGTLWALAEIVEPRKEHTDILNASAETALRSTVFARLTGRMFINPIFRPELISEAASRLIRALANRVRLDAFTATATQYRIWTAILEASLVQTKETVLDEAVAAAEPLLMILSPLNRRNLVSSWCSIIEDPRYRQRGHVLALAAVASRAFPDDGEILGRIITALISAATRKNEPELRCTGVKALTDGILSAGVVHSQISDVLTVINNSLDDYTVDTRGDVGSLVRAEAISAVSALGRHHDLYFPPTTDSNLWSELVGKVVRMTAEKLNRLRVAASTALVSLPLPASLTPIITPLKDDIINSSATSYFATLLPLLSTDYATHILSGFLSSASAGSDTVLRSSRQALITFLATSPPADFTETLLSVFRTSVGNSDDRIITPALDIASLLLDLDLLELTPKQARSLLVLTQKAHYKTSLMQKLVTAVRVYASLGVAEKETADAGRRLLALMKHPWPRVRMEAAEGLWVLGRDKGMELETLGGVEWGGKAAVTSVESVKGQWEKVAAA